MNQGSTVSVDDGTPVPVRRELDRSEEQRSTILIVDDERENVESLSDFLTDSYRVFGTTSANEAIRIAQENEVDVVMTDQRMPEMTGVELLARIREVSPDTVRLLTTAYADIGTVIDAINKGSIYRYIVKPWDPDELLTIIRSATERHDLIVERKRLIDELKMKNEELARSNALKEAFIRVASHELRSPVTILTAIHQLVFRRKDVPPPVRELLGRGAQAVARLNRIIDQLTTVLAIGQWNRPLDRRATDVAGIVRRAVDEVRPFVETRNQNLELEEAPELGFLDLDAEKIHDALSQLLMNAIKFTPDGGRIGVKARRREDGWLAIDVSDTGIGIDAPSLGKVFEPFFTSFDVSRHTSGQFEFGSRGMGLGLAVVKGFVTMHGGDVTVSSRAGSGTTFTITLPP
jgi:signal transduction histidine kinase